MPCGIFISQSQIESTPPAVEALSPTTELSWNFPHNVQGGLNDYCFLQRYHTILLRFLFLSLSLTDVAQEKLKQFQCVSPWFYLDEDSSLKIYKSILYEWHNFYWSIHHCIKIPYFTEKVQAAKFQFSLQHKIRLYLQVDVSTSIDVLGFNQWLGNPTSHAGGPKKQTKAVWLRVSTSLCWAEEKYSAFQRIVLTAELGGSFPASLVVCHWFCLFSFYG